MRRTVKCVFILAVAVVGTAFVWNVTTKFQSSARRVSFSELLRDVDSGSVATISMQGDEVIGVNRQTGPFRTYAPRGYVGFVNRLVDRGVDVSVGPEGLWSAPCVPWVLMIVLTQASMFLLLRRSLPRRA